jgi:hypothetical protein
MKSAFQVVALLVLLIFVLLGAEAFLLVRGWSSIEDLRAANQVQIQANARLEAEIGGLKVSQARINALFTRLSESIVRKRNPEINENSTNRSLLANRDTVDQEPSVISRMSELGVVSQLSRVPNGEAAIIYMAGSSNLEFSRVVSFIAELENSNPFLYFDRVALNRPPSVPPFSTAPTYLDCRFTIRLLSAK